MKSLLSPLLVAGLVAGLLSGCKRPFAPNPRVWFIESYENGIITARHEGNTYDAACAKGGFYNAVNPRSNVEYSTCDMAIGLVGHEVQPFEDKRYRRDADGEIVAMWLSYGNLELRSWRDEQSWRHEMFLIKLVRTTPR